MNIVILGAGIGGLTTAIALKKQGLPVVVYEAAPEIRAVGAGLVLAANAIKAFRKLEIDQAVMAEGCWMLSASKMKKARSSPTPTAWRPAKNMGPTISPSTGPTCTRY
jgi:2-polyprenyl-6-methoxyphenol hydroxylase-like FAD-dependent oxidoreductase